MESDLERSRRRPESSEQVRAETFGRIRLPRLETVGRLEAVEDLARQYG